MPEATNYVFSYKEIAELLIKEQGINEGFWGIWIEFGIAAANIPINPEDKSLMPAAIVPVKRIGIQKFDEPNSLTVDAASINPVKKTRKKNT